MVSSYFKVLKLDLNARFSNYDYGPLTCPANRPHSVAQSVSGEQLDCSDTQPEANSLQKIPHSPNLFSKKKIYIYIVNLAKIPIMNIITCSI